jgi:hypothetical protein
LNILKIRDDFAMPVSLFIAKIKKLRQNYPDLLKRGAREKPFLEEKVSRAYFPVPPQKKSPNFF